MTQILLWLGIFLLVETGHGFASESEFTEWGPVTNGVQMSITLKNNEQQFATNQPVLLLLRIKNVSSNETYMIRNQLSTFSFVVFSPSGKDRSPKRGPDNYLASWRFIEPSRTEQWVRDLRRICNFDEAGTYRIMAKATIIRRGESGKALEEFKIVSNRLSVFVDKPPLRVVPQDTPGLK